MLLLLRVAFNPKISVTLPKPWLGMVKIKWSQQMFNFTLPKFLLQAHVEANKRSQLE